MTQASIWPASAQDLRFRRGFVSKTPEITTFGGGTQFFWGGGGTRYHPGRIAKPLENKAQHDTCNSPAHLCRRSTFQRGLCQQNPENDHVLRRVPRFFGGVGGSKEPSSEVPTFPRVGTLKCCSRCGMASRFGVYVSDTTFRTVTFPRSTAAAKAPVE